MRPNKKNWAVISTTKVRELARIAVKTPHLGWRVVFDGVALTEFE